MIKILGKIPNDIAIAVSGGADSMAVLDFLRRSRHVVALHYNHKTGEHADKAEKVVYDYCNKHSIALVTGRCREEMPDGVSKEAWWRDQRYKFFVNAVNCKIITAHHLNDAVENWIFTSLNGNPFMIPSSRDQFIRPFLTTEKETLLAWCENKSVPFVEDPSNLDTKFRRNYIRHVMMPHVLSINPGIKKVIRKKLLDSHR